MLTLSCAQTKPDRRGSCIIDAFNLQCKAGVVRFDVGVSPIYNPNKSCRGGRRAAKKIVNSGPREDPAKAHRSSIRS